MPMWRTLCRTSLTKLYPKPRPVGSAAPASCSCALPSLQQEQTQCLCYGRWIEEQQPKLSQSGQQEMACTPKQPINIQLLAPEVGDKGICEGPGGRLRQGCRWAARQWVS